MKLTLTILLFSLASITASTYSQNTRLDIAFEDGNITELFQEIQEQSEFYFFYQKEALKELNNVTVNAKDATVMEILDEALASKNMSYEIVDRYIVVRPANDSFGEEILASVREANSAQQQAVSGTVTDESDDPLPGVTVVVKGTTQGTVTNADGEFSLDISEEADTLQFSFVGMRTQEVAIEGRTTFTVVMEEETIGIEEVVAVGYGVESRRSLTSSVSSVNMEDALKTRSASVAQSLAGRAAGLSAFMESAQPGGRVDLQIRGSATNRSPLIVIDGMPTASPSVSQTGWYQTGELDNVLSSLNPNDIERIDILKDASATSIYGSKAAGGVILITTKKGRTVSDPEGTHSITFDASVGVQNIKRLPEMLKPVEYMEMTNATEYERWLYRARSDVYSDVSKSDNWSPPSPYQPYFTETEIDEFRTGNRTGTDWVSEVTTSGLVQDYNLSFTGNHKNTRYYASFSAFDQEGVVINNELKKYTGRVNVEQDYGDKLTGGINITFSQINQDNPLIGGEGQSAEVAGILWSALRFMPTIPVYDESGRYSTNPRISVLANPVSYREIENINKTERFFSTIYFNYRISEEMRLKVQGGFDRNQNGSYGYIPTSTLMGASVGGQADRAEDKNNNYQFQSLLNYNKTLGDKHNIAGLLGVEYMKYKRESLSVNAKDFPFDGALWNNMRLGTSTPIVWSTGGSNEIISYFTRLNYNFDEKYFLTANFRVDGSSNFSPENQYGYFPGVSIGWDLRKESFMENLHWADQIKLRIGYGETGNDQIGAAFFDWYSPGRTILWGSNLMSGIGLAGLGNPDLKWEKQVDLNVGLDFSLFNQRVTGEIDVFNRVISRILGTRDIGSWNPVSSISYNLDAEKQTYGGEVTLNTKNIESTDFSWNSTFTLTYYRDRWLKRDPSYVLGINESPKQYFDEIWSYKSDGIVQVGEYDEVNKIPGSVRILDVDSYLLDDEGSRVVDENGKPMYAGEPDGSIDAADLVKVGVNTPYTIGVNNSLRYKQFDLSAYIYGVFNRWKTPHYFINPSGLLSDAYNQQKDYTEIWAHDNQDGKYPGMGQNFTSRSGGTGDFYLEEAWFIRFKNISLGYSIPKGVLKNFRIYGNIMNPILITPYSGVDPETDVYDAAYPNYQTFSVGIQANF